MLFIIQLYIKTTLWARIWNMKTLWTFLHIILVCSQIKIQSMHFFYNRRISRDCLLWYFYFYFFQQPLKNLVSTHWNNHLKQFLHTPALLPSIVRLFRSLGAIPSQRLVRLSSVLQALDNLTFLRKCFKLKKIIWCVTVKNPWCDHIKFKLLKFGFFSFEWEKHRCLRVLERKRKNIFL